MPNKQKYIGIFSFVCLIIGMTSIVVYLTGGKLINDNVTMLSSLTSIVIALILSWFSKNNVIGRISLYVSAILLGVFVFFFVGMSLFWNET
ncbi:hypothetical protein ACFQ4N_09585 [Oceanobacillus iheyensis]|uniref:hypothetical protein n=1 Tax=Oceanobacillus iheyensis TaxID=182710 RepID=UPI00059F8A5C|nr:hypothetical protein [Oceanobacillus iheyensis]